MKITLLTIISFFILINQIQAQVQVIRCSADEYQAALEEANPEMAAQRLTGEIAIQHLIQNNPTYKVGGVVTIPVVFHVIYANAAQNIPDTRIFEQLNVMNQDFGRTNLDAANTRAMFQSVAANTEIQFCLAQRTPQGAATNGILRVPTTNSTLPNNPNSISPEWDRTKYLNVYIGNLSGGLLGYANLPPGISGNDHIVVLFSSVGGPNALGTINGYNLGRTVTHEIGHWLNLQHTFNGGCSGLSGNTCMGSGDFVCDTPPISNATSNCPTNNPNTCTETSPFPAPYIGHMVNQFENYMDYSTDVCMNMFTEGQSTRMNAAITLYRSSLLTSDGCIPVGLNEIIDESFITVSPNPSNGIFNIQFLFPVNTEVTLNIADMKGQEIFSGTYDKSMNRTVELDLTGYASGVYQMMVRTKSGYLVKRLVIGNVTR